MTTNTKQKAASATNTNGLHTYTNGPDFRIGGAEAQVPDGKAIATQIASLALAGHAAPYALAIVQTVVLRDCA